MEFSDVPRMCANTYNETTMLLQVRNVHILRQKKLEAIRRTLDEKNFFDVGRHSDRIFPGM